MFILKGCFSVLEGVRLQLEDTKKELSQTQARVEKQRHIVTEASQGSKKTGEAEGKTIGGISP